MPLTSPRAKDTRGPESSLSVRDAPESSLGQPQSAVHGRKNSLISGFTYRLMLAASVPDSCGTGTF